MFGMGMPEILLILAIALIVIGPKKLPELAKSLGRAMNEFKRATSEFKDTLELDNDVKKTFDDIDAELRKPIDIASEPVENSSEDSVKKDKIAIKDKGEKDKKEDKDMTENTDVLPEAEDIAETAKPEKKLKKNSKIKKGSRNE